MGRNTIVWNPGVKHFLCGCEEVVLGSEFQHTSFEVVLRLTYAYAHVSYIP